jgi:hypothetical protein
MTEKKKAASKKDPRLVRAGVSGFLYVCVATNTWKRVALSSW